MDNAQAGKEYMGVVKSWRTDKGFGFITSDEDGKDLFVHQSAIVIEGSAYRAVLPGTKVIFSVQIRDGKETAVDVKSSIGGPLKGFSTKLEATQMIGSGPVEPGSRLGKVKFFNVEKGFGFIVPEEGNEIFFNIADVEGNVKLNKDDSVRYSIGEGKKAGSEQAKNIRRLGPVLATPEYPNPYSVGAYGGYPPPPQTYGAYGAPPAAQFYGGVPPYSPAALPGAGRPGQRAGTIKWYNAEKGFGFIVPSNGDKDVYFKGDAIVDGTLSFPEGDPVTFEERQSEGKSWGINIARARGGGEAKGKRKADVYPEQQVYGKLPRSEAPAYPYGESFGNPPAAGYYSQPGQGGYPPQPYHGHGGAAYDPYNVPSPAAPRAQPEYGYY